MSFSQFLCISQYNISQLLTKTPPPPPAVPTALLIMKHKDFYLMVWSSLWRSDPTFRKRKRLFQRIFQLVSTEARREHLCLKRLLLNMEPESTWASSSPYATSASSSVPLSCRRQFKHWNIRGSTQRNLLSCIEFNLSSWKREVKTCVIRCPVLKQSNTMNWG